MTFISSMSGPRKIKKIMLVIPPNIIEKNSIRRIGEPVGPLMIATYLKGRGFDIHIYDMTLEGYDNCRPVGDCIIYGSSGADLKERLAREKPDLVGLSCMFSTKEALTLEMAQVIKAFDPSIVVAVGGIAPTVDPESYLKTEAVDYVVMHDGEMRLEKLINNLNTARPAEEGLDGLAWRKSGQVLIGPAAPDSGDHR